MENCCWSHGRHKTFWEKVLYKWYRVKDKVEDFYLFFKYLPRKIWRSLQYSKYVFSTNDWDWCETNILQLIYLKLGWMIEDTKNWHTVLGNRPKQMAITREICKRLMNQSPITADQEHWCHDELHMDLVDEPNGNARCVFRGPRPTYLDKFYWDYLFKMLHKHMNSWWD